MAADEKNGTGGVEPSRRTLVPIVRREIFCRRGVACTWGGGPKSPPSMERLPGGRAVQSGGGRRSYPPMDKGKTLLSAEGTSQLKNILLQTKTTPPRRREKSGPAIRDATLQQRRPEVRPSTKKRNSNGTSDEGKNHPTPTFDLHQPNRLPLKPTPPNPGDRYQGDGKGNKTQTGFFQAPPLPKKKTHSPSTGKVLPFLREEGFLLKERKRAFTPSPPGRRPAYPTGESLRLLRRKDVYHQRRGGFYG